MTINRKRWKKVLQRLDSEEKAWELIEDHYQPALNEQLGANSPLRLDVFHEFPQARDGRVKRQFAIVLVKKEEDEEGQVPRHRS